METLIKISIVHLRNKKIKQYAQYMFYVEQHQKIRNEKRPNEEDNANVCTT